MGARPKLDVATAIVRREHEVLLVLQGRPGEELFWALPGGIVEEGELVPDGLVREVREEAGVEIRELGPLAYVTHLDWRRPARIRGREVAGYIATVWTFEVDSWFGELRVDDPDGVVVDAAFVQAREAADRLARTEWLELAAGYLRGDIRRGSFHVERWHADGAVSRPET